MPMTRLGDVTAALAKPISGGFHKIELDTENPRFIYLDAAELAAENASVQTRFGLPALQRLD